MRLTFQLRDIFTRKIKGGDEEIDVMNWMSRVALEYIGQGGLGYSFDAFNENKTDTYSDAIKMLGSVVVLRHGTTSIHIEDDYKPSRVRPHTTP